MCESIDIDAILRELRGYATPEAFLALLAPAKAVPNEWFFNDPRLKPLLEAWAAGQFASALERNEHRVQVRLEEEDHEFPDFRLSVDSAEFQFECTSADRSGRRRGLEYRQRAKDPFLMTPYRPAQGEQEGPAWTAQAVQRKADKQYAAKPHLLVYANFEANALDLQKCLDLCREGCSRFGSVWVLWSMRIGK